MRKLLVTAHTKAGFVLGATVFVLPFLMSWLHVGALRDAAEAEPATSISSAPER